MPKNKFQKLGTYNGTEVIDKIFSTIDVNEEFNFTTIALKEFYEVLVLVDNNKAPGTSVFNVWVIKSSSGATVCENYRLISVISMFEKLSETFLMN